MSLTGIISGACAVLTATSAFDDSNISWMDPGIVETTGCRWAAMLTLETSEPERMAFGSVSERRGVWQIIMRGWVKHGGAAAFSTWQDDNKTFPQDVIDAITGDDTLSGSATDATVVLASVEPVSLKGVPYSEYVFVIDAEEYDI